MPAEEFGPRYFTRERIRNRMLKRAAEIWGYTELEMDEFDPLVSLLIESCALEMERVASEIGQTQNRMMERLVQLLYPETTSTRPAYGVIQATPGDSAAVVETNAQFVARHSAADRRKGDNDLMHFFSPIRSSHLIKANIRYQATSRQIYAVQKGIQKVQVAASGRNDPHQQYSLWLGLDVDPGVISLKKTTFFFNWSNDPDADTWYQHLLYTQWYIKNHALNFEPGLLSDDTADIMSLLEGEFDSMKRLEMEVLQLFNRQFLTISSGPDLKNTENIRENYPPIFERWYAKRDLEEFQKPLLWIEIRFPTSFSPRAIDDVLCSINSFPVLARKLNKSYQWLRKKLNIFPLKSEGSFLSVKEIAGTNGHSLKLVPFGNPDDLQPETYTLRYGANRFNERNSYEALTGLLEQIREESSFFSSLGDEFLVQHIRDLEEILARMDGKIKPELRLQTSFPFLAVNSGKEGANVMIEFWSCLGEASNRIPMGTELMLYENNNVRLDNLFMMATTAGGKDTMNDAKKITHYKKSLFTRNRIVTTEDLRSVVTAELRAVKSVAIRKSFRKGVEPGVGFMRHIDIIVTPSEEDKTDRQEWELRFKNLKVVLEKQSAGNIPYYISLNNPA